jgi:hypothetical protein
VFEVGEHECGFDDVTDLAGAGGEVAQCAPAAGQECEPAFAQAAQPAQQGVVGAAVDAEPLHHGYGPKGRRVGRYVRYDSDDVRRWFESLDTTGAA